MSHAAASVLYWREQAALNWRTPTYVYYCREQAAYWTSVLMELDT